MKEKYYIVLEEYERRMIINSLNELRNRLIADGRYTEAVDEILLKIINAKKTAIGAPPNNPITSKPNAISFHASSIILTPYLFLLTLPQNSSGI